MRRWAITLLAAFIGARLLAGEAGPDGSGLDEHVGRHVPGSLTFRDQRDHELRFADLLHPGRPVLLLPAYYRCPLLCGLVLESTTRAVGAISWRPGRDYELVTASFDSDDRPAHALQKQSAVLKGVPAGKRIDEPDWPFLSADQRTIDELLDALGERVRRQENGEIVHPAVVVVLSPDGTIDRYLDGVAMKPRDVELALLEAASGRRGTALQRALLYCYRYDPATRRYGWAISWYLQVGAALSVIGAGVGIAALIRVVRARRPA